MYVLDYAIMTSGQMKVTRLTNHKNIKVIRKVNEEKRQIFFYIELNVRQLKENVINYKRVIEMYSLFWRVTQIMKTINKEQ